MAVGSAWKEYKQSGTVHTMKQEPGLTEFQKFTEPILTPSTKAEQGAHDENISPYDGLSHSQSVQTQMISLITILSSRDYCWTRCLPEDSDCFPPTLQACIRTRRTC